MGYRSSDAGHPGGNQPPHGRKEPRGNGPEARLGDHEKSEVSSLLRLLTQLANCGLDAAAEPLLQTTTSES